MLLHIHQTWPPHHEIRYSFPEGLRLGVENDNTPVAAKLLGPDIHMVRGHKKGQVSKGVLSCTYQHTTVSHAVLDFLSPVLVMRRAKVQI